ncbi:hypothetical protein THRCLA_20614 [Thraustotheca clavata]|uniref:Uncharacterized protein n=1 Tax=Thraustotheca clavata TaxID=74557 RepID=A0A1W0A5C0_9STRA|nr:hypothetical protein THRCLA_20614 [Thraustotheca clavata]
MTVANTTRCRLHLLYSDELVKTRTDSVFRSMLHQLARNDENEVNTKLLKKALMYRNRTQHLTKVEGTEVALSFGVRWHKIATL